MARSFTITTTATDTLKADDKGHAQAVFTVTNATARPVRGWPGLKRWATPNASGFQLPVRLNVTLEEAGRNSLP